MTSHARSLAVLACLGLSSFVAPPAFAGPYGDELSKCLVNSTTSEDKTFLTRWIFATMALHPEVRALAAVSDEQRTEINRRMGRLLEKLLTESCRKETREAVKYEGMSTLEGAFSVLGSVAARELFSNQLVTDGTAAFASHLDAEKLKEVLEEKPSPDAAAEAPAEAPAEPPAKP